MQQPLQVDSDATRNVQVHSTLVTDHEHSIAEFSFVKCSFMHF